MMLMIDTLKATVVIVSLCSLATYANEDLGKMLNLSKKNKEFGFDENILDNNKITNCH